MNFYKVDKTSNMPALVADMIEKLLANGFTIIYDGSVTVDATAQPTTIKCFKPKTFNATTGLPATFDYSFYSRYTGGDAAIPVRDSKAAQSSLIGLSSFSTVDVTLPVSQGSYDVTLECPQSMVPPGCQKWRIKLYAKGQAYKIAYLPALGAKPHNSNITQAVVDLGETSAWYYNGYAANIAGYDPYQYYTVKAFFNPETKDAKSFYTFLDKTPENVVDPAATGYTELVRYGTDLTIEQMITYEYFEQPTTLNIVVGTAQTLKDDGSICYSVSGISKEDGTGVYIIDAIGHLSGANIGYVAGVAAAPATSTTPAVAPITEIKGNEVVSLHPTLGEDYQNDFIETPKSLDSKFFLSRFRLSKNDAFKNSVDLSYCMSITNRGLAICMWESVPRKGVTNKLNRLSWLVIQHSVLKESGSIRGSTAETAESKCPVFCVYSCPGSNGDQVENVYRYFVVQEKDVSAPSGKYTFGTDDDEDRNASINTLNQVSFKEDGNYLATFISDLTTDRYFYPDDLDMVGTISADVVGDAQELSVRVYNEAADRTYLSMPANKPNGTGMRILILKSNPNE